MVEAPTYVIKIPLTPSDLSKNGNENTLFEYSTTGKDPKHMQYEELLDTILETAKQNRQCRTTRMEDKGTGFVDYIHLENAGINLETIRLNRNGTENIGDRRIPRGDVPKFVGPMPYLKNYNKEENTKDERDD